MAKDGGESMRQSILSTVVLLSLFTFAAIADGQAELSTEARRNAIIGLYAVQAQARMELQNPVVDHATRAHFRIMLAKKDPEKRFGAMETRTLTSFSKIYDKWEDSGSTKNLINLLQAINDAKARYNPPPFGTLSAFSKTLNELAESSTLSVDRPTLREAAESASWINGNLDGASLEKLNPASRTSFVGLFQLLADYQLTGDSRVLNLLGADLKIMKEHCRTTGQRADQPTQFTVDTIDAKSTKLPHWVVYAVSLVNEVKRVGDPSTPVTGELMPGEWIFFAEKDGERSLGERHVVSKGKLEPPNILIRKRP